MSPRDIQWFLAGAATGLIAGALGFYLLFGSNTVTSNTVTQNSLAMPPPQASTPDLLMPGDRWPTPADANSVSSTPTPTDPTHASQAGALDEVTRKLAQRLATQGGSDDDWNLLAQSYDYMGRADDARAARKHIAKPD